ncbi:hypothetical protein Vadar_031593 [Vaccinium darrowii]|uniref:Uncharacterized protein n=1 Tax=Vaccinium darrowii TaxID=229202 RepID=A0ACB7Y3E3_9ERIC|nr:hypothetical protein Vadar_031593 [Vaccinium darrowii]
MGGGGRRSNGLSSSSGEEDGDADWKAAIDSVAVTATINDRTSTDRVASTSNGSSTKSLGRATQQDEDGGVDNRNPQNLKHYQIKAQKLLDGILEKTIEIVGEDPICILDDDSMISGGGVRLFKHAPPGIVFDHIDELQRPTKKPRILPSKEIDEKSKKFRCQLKSIAIDGMDIIAAANHSHQQTLAKREAKDAAVKAAAKSEEERVAELRKIRGERWLPSLARDMRANSRDSEKWFLVVSVSFSLSLEIKVREMAVFLAAAVDGLGHCTMVLWGWQERRFDVVLDTVSSAGRALTVALAFCFLSIHHLYSRGQLPIPFL